MSMRVGLLTTIVVHACNIVYGLILPRMLILTYGSDVNGVVAGSLQIVSLVALLEAGLSAASIRQLYAPLREENAPLVGRVLGSVRHQYFRVACWAAGVGLAAGVGYAQIVISAQSFLTVVLIAWVVLTGPILDFALNSKYFVYFVASQQVSKFQVAQLSAIVCKVVVVLSCARADVGVLSMLFILSMVPILKWAVLSVVFTRELYRIVSGLPRVRIEQRGAVFGHQLLGSIIYSGPVIYVVAAVGSASASVFSVNNMVFGIAYMFTSMVMGQVVVARMGHLYVGGELRALGRIADGTAIGVAGGAFVVMSSSVILLPSFLQLYLGEVGANYYSPTDAALFALWGFANLVKLVPQTVVNAAGRFRDTLWISVVEVGVFLVVLVAGFQSPSVTCVLGALLLSALTKWLLLCIFTGLHLVRWSPSVVVVGGVSALALIGMCFAPIPSVDVGSVFEWVRLAVVVCLSLALVGTSLILTSLGFGRLIRSVSPRAASFSPGGPAFPRAPDAPPETSPEPPATS